MIIKDKYNAFFGKFTPLMYVLITEIHLLPIIATLIDYNLNKIQLQL